MSTKVILAAAGGFAVICAASLGSIMIKEAHCYNTTDDPEKLNASLERLKKFSEICNSVIEKINPLSKSNNDKKS